MGTTMSSLSFASPSSNIAPEHWRRTAHSSSTSARLRATLKASVCCCAQASTSYFKSSTSLSDPASSSRMTGRPLCPGKTARPVARSAQSTLSRSRNSQIAGCTRARNSTFAAVSAAPSSLKDVSSVHRAAGCGTSLSTAPVTMPSMPSLPIHRSRRLKPAANFLVAVPHSTNSPVGRKPRRAMTKSRVTPYLPPCMPPALQAMLPPMVQYSFDEGSGG